MVCFARTFLIAMRPCLLSNRRKRPHTKLQIPPALSCRSPLSRNAGVLWWGDCIEDHDMMILEQPGILAKNQLEITIIDKYTMVYLCYNVLGAWKLCSDSCGECETCSSTCKLYACRRSGFGSTTAQVAEHVFMKDVLMACFCAACTHLGAII